MVIDGGPAASAQYVYSYIRSTLKLTRLRCVVSTHPPEDHAGGLPSVLNAAPADLLLSPVTEWNSGSFRNMLKYAEKQGAPVAVPREGNTLRLGGATVTVLHCWPEAVGLGRANDASIVLRVDYGNTSFLYTGDAEDWSEYSMLDAGINLKADVLKVSHHGSSSGNTRSFLNSVRPEYAVISVGKGNDYGHPHSAVLSRLSALNCRILRTDEIGTVILRSDGETVTRAGSP